MSKEFASIPWVRYADDGCLNCVSLKQAKYIIKVLDKRFKTFGLELNLSKTKNCILQRYKKERSL